MDLAAYQQHLHALQQAAWPEGAPRTPQYPLGQQPLTEYLRAWAQSQASAVALDFYGYQLSFAELDRLSDRCAALLGEQGIGPGTGWRCTCPTARNCISASGAFSSAAPCTRRSAPWRAPWSWSISSRTAAPG